MYIHSPEYKIRYVDKVSHFWVTDTDLYVRREMFRKDIKLALSWGIKIIGLTLENGNIVLTDNKRKMSVDIIKYLMFNKCTENTVYVDLYGLISFDFFDIQNQEVVQVPEGVEIINVSNGSPTKFKIKKIILPSTLRVIDASAFELFSNVEEIVLNDGIVQIRADAFYTCINLRKINLPESLKMIQNSAFAFCSNLESIKIPRGVTSINSHLFSNCYKLKSVELHEDIDCIGENAFEDCISLESLKVPKKVKLIKNKTFLNCKSLKVIEVSEDCSILDDSLKSDSIKIIKY